MPADKGRAMPVQRLQSQRGMTLIEIMIVLTILGGIAAFIITSVAGSQDKANMKQAKILINSVASALDLYYTDCGKYPESIEGLLQNPGNCKDWGPRPYLTKKPKDPWGHELIFETDADGFNIISLGKDGQEGGEGVNADISYRDSQKE